MSKFVNGVFDSFGMTGMSYGRAILSGLAVLALIVAVGSFKKPGGAEENEQIAKREADAANIEQMAMHQCQQSTRFEHPRAKLGMPASARMPNGDYMIRQPFTVGKRDQTARCTVRAAAPDRLEFEVEQGYATL